jgi:hypothetical protein
LGERGGTEEDQPSPESAVGKERRSIMQHETEAHDVSIRPEENRSRTAGTMGKMEGEESSLELVQRKKRHAIQAFKRAFFLV